MVKTIDICDVPVSSVNIPQACEIIDQWISERKKTYSFIQDEIKKDRQVFIICPLIEESETLEVTSAKKEYERRKKEIFPHFSPDLLQGKKKPKEKGRIHLLARLPRINKSPLAIGYYDMSPESPQGVESAQHGIMVYVTRSVQHQPEPRRPKAP